MERAFEYLERVEPQQRPLYWKNLSALLEYRRLRVHFTIHFFACKDLELTRQKNSLDSVKKQGRCVQLDTPCGICKTQVKRRDFSQLLGEQPQCFYASTGRGLCHSTCFENRTKKKSASGKRDSSS
jgi:hypothetical protein